MFIRHSTCQTEAPYALCTNSFYGSPRAERPAAVRLPSNCQCFDGVRAFSIAASVNDVSSDSGKDSSIARAQNGPTGNVAPLKRPNPDPDLGQFTSCNPSSLSPSP